MTVPPKTPHRCGYAVLLGRPNAGKSTLLNTWLGSKLAITSHKPQTTRDRIVGVWSAPGVQAILCDTPGVHRAWTELNKVMVRKAAGALADADVVLWLEDMTGVAGRIKAGKPAFDEDTEPVLEMMRAAGKPVIFLANKMDLVEPMYALPAIEAAQAAVPMAAAVPISALSGDGLDGLQRELAAVLPEGPALFPKDTLTEASERFLSAEIIREKIFHLTEQEVPYATAVVIEKFDESERTTKNLVRLHAAILVERPAQKAILIGKGGDMIKRIGTAARVDIQTLLDCRVHLELFVKVERDWSRTAQGLRRAGFDVER
jgi:GTP-binding protein Era